MILTNTASKTKDVISGDNAGFAIVKVTGGDDDPDNGKKDKAYDGKLGDRGFGTVLAFGGDGTLNEAAQGLVGTDVALGVLPGGSTNVLARSAGVPRDPVDGPAAASARHACHVGAQIAEDARGHLGGLAGQVEHAEAVEQAL